MTAEHLKKSSTTGHLLYNSNKNLVHSCGGDPCDIDCASLAGVFTILGVNDLAACDDCTDSAWPAWDGKAYKVDDDCLWLLNDLASVAGKQPSYSTRVAADCTAGQPNGCGIWYNRDQCQWELAITCTDGSGNYRVIWCGTKAVTAPGSTPAGIYTRVCGCDDVTEEVEVV